MIVRTALLVALALFVAGCETKEEAKARNEALLPAGCKIVDLSYGDLTAAVVCDGRKTTNTVKSWDETQTQATVQPDGSVQTTTNTIHHSRINATIGPEVKDGD